jgi:hypothetical protein
MTALPAAEQTRPLTQQLRLCCHPWKLLLPACCVCLQLLRPVSQALQPLLLAPTWLLHHLTPKVTGRGLKRAHHHPRCLAPQPPHAAAAGGAALQA